MRIRQILFALLVVMFLIAFYGFLTEGIWWVTVGDQQFNQLWNTLPEAHTLLGLLISPMLITLVVGFYWLQRLLLELGRGHFFSAKSMVCLKWLAWLSMFGVAYDMSWPILATLIIESVDSLSIEVSVISLITVLCLPVVVHLYSAAAELDRENKEII